MRWRRTPRRRSRPSGAGHAGVEHRDLQHDAGVDDRAACGSGTELDQRWRALGDVERRPDLAAAPSADDSRAVIVGAGLVPDVARGATVTPSRGWRRPVRHVVEATRRPILGVGRRALAVPPGRWAERRPAGAAVDAEAYAGDVSATAAVGGRRRRRRPRRSSTPTRRSLATCRRSTRVDAGGDDVAAVHRVEAGSRSASPRSDLAHAHRQREGIGAHVVVTTRRRAERRAARCAEHDLVIGPAAAMATRSPRRGRPSRPERRASRRGS